MQTLNGNILLKIKPKPVTDDSGITHSSRDDDTKLIECTVVSSNVLSVPEGVEVLISKYSGENWKDDMKIVPYTAILLIL